MQANDTATAKHFLNGGGELGERMRNLDWNTTPLGDISRWPQSLKTATSICIDSGFPMLVCWGPQFVMIYNDGYIPVLGKKHPAALGTPLLDCWFEIKDMLQPMFQGVVDSGKEIFAEDLMFPLGRHGFIEECYFTFSYSPIRDETGGVGGVLVTCTETTQRVISARRLKTLHELANRPANAKRPKHIFANFTEVLSENRYDLPFALFYHLGDERKNVRLVCCSGLEEGSTIAPEMITLERNENKCWPIRDTLQSLKPLLLNIDEEILPKNAVWQEPCTKALLLPAFKSDKENLFGVLICGLSSRLFFDEDYKSFLNLIAHQISTTLSGIEAYETERRKALALAQLDRAKTSFFSNISHEFRTPLTLMLGPLEELMRLPDTEISKRSLSNIETTHRNAMRLLKLVNTLLDFSRIESGRQKAMFTLVDIAAFTQNLASNFRSVIESAGLEFNVSAEKIDDPVYVDKQMWETIVFNLLSNAFKYTFNGSISLNLFSENDRVILKVADTGIGIPEKELPHMFERFHRIEGAAGRTYEGTGIGLSMIKELVQLHSGDISVESREGSGSTFTVTIPKGKEHLDTRQITTSESDLESTISDVFVDEAMALLQDGSLLKEETVVTGGVKADLEKSTTILIVDDNADIRKYLQSLLENNYQVITAANGAEAISEIKKRPPTLILSDIMMPVMDGFEFLREVKQNSATSSIPIILLSARAGEEEKIKGYDIGADDYLIKPFSAKELMARVRSQLKISKTRLLAEQHLKNLFLQAPLAISIFKGPKQIVEVANERMLEIWGRTAEQVMNKPIFDAIPEARNQGFEKLLESVYKTGKRFIAPEICATLIRNNEPVQIFAKLVYEPLRDEEGNIVGVMTVADEITEQVITRRKVEESEKLFRTLAETLPQMIWTRTAEGKIEFGSKRWEEYSGSGNISEAWKAMVHPDDWENVMNRWRNDSEKGSSFRYEVRLRNKNGDYRWHSAVGEPIKDEAGKIIKWVGALTDIHQQKTFTENLEKEVALRTSELMNVNIDLKKSQEHFSLLFNASPVPKAISKVADGTVIDVNPAWEQMFDKRSEQIIGKSLLQEELFPPGKHLSLVKEITQNGGAIENKEVKFDFGNGKVLYVLLSVVTIEMNSEKFFLSTFVDITFRKLAEQKMEQANLELLQMNKELQSFAYISSHDLQEPLRKIQTFASQILEKEDKQLTEFGKDRFRRMQKAAVRMQTLIEDLLAYSRTNTSERKYEKTTLHKIVEEVKEDLKEELQQKQARIEIIEMCALHVIPFQFRQLLLNLINNSIKFSKPKQPPLIKIKSEIVQGERLNNKNPEKNKVYCHISVSDNGIGFEQKYSEKIFEVFQRLHGGNEYKGTGIGLAIVKKIVENHNGFIAANGELDKGATFDIYIPAI